MVVPTIDHGPAPTSVREPSASPEERAPWIHREPPGSPPVIVEGSTADGPGTPPHRRRAAAVIRQLGIRTEAALRRELDRFFAARPGLSHADRAAIARAMSRFRNQLLHQPRSTLRAAADAGHPAGSHPLLDAVHHLLGLADTPHTDPPGPRTPGKRPTKTG
jgi:hypothetical protein